MIKQIIDVLEEYKNAKTALDKEKADTMARWKRDFTPSKIQEVLLDYEKAHLLAENTIRETALAKIEKELSKVDQWAAAMLDDLNPDLLAEVKALDGLMLSNYQIQTLQQRFAGNYWASAAFAELVNRNRSEVDRLTVTSPETFLQVADRLKSDCIFILQNYGEGAGTEGTNVAGVKIQLLEKNFEKYFDAFTCEYISEPDFDRPAPLTAAEKRTIDALFADCTGAYTALLRAEELAGEGYAGLIKRSEYAKHLRDYEEPIQLSEAGKRALYGADISNTEPEPSASVEMNLFTD